MTLESFGFKKRLSGETTVPDEPQIIKENAHCLEVGPVVKKRRYNSRWTENRPWLQYDCEMEVMFCVWCRQYDRTPDRNQFAKGCSSMKVESIKKHEISRQHKDCESANRARATPHEAPLERAIMSMGKEQQEKMEKLFRSAYYLVQAERPFRDFANLMELQEVNGLSFGETYRNSKQCRTFVNFIAEEIRSNLIQALQREDFYSVCMDSRTDLGVIEEEIIQVRYLENNLPVYRLALLNKHSPFYKNRII